MMCNQISPLNELVYDLAFGLITSTNSSEIQISNPPNSLSSSLPGCSLDIFFSSSFRDNASIFTQLSLTIETNQKNAITIIPHASIRVTLNGIFFVRRAIRIALLAAYTRNQDSGSGSFSCTSAARKRSRALMEYRSITAFSSKCNVLLFALAYLWLETHQHRSSFRPANYQPLPMIANWR